MPTLSHQHTPTTPALLPASSASPCLPPELIDGKAIAETIRQELKAEVEELKLKHGGKVGSGAVGRRGGQGLVGLRLSGANSSEQQQQE